MWKRLFRSNRAPGSDPAATAGALRKRALATPPEDYGFAPSPERPHVFGVLMETGYEQAVATLVVYVDGAVSLYFSSGGGVIGAGGHETVRRAAAALLDAAEKLRPMLGPAETSDFPLPAIGRVRFYVRTFDGTLTAEAAERELGERRHLLSPLFYAAHGVITAVREATEPPGDLDGR